MVNLNKSNCQQYITKIYEEFIELEVSNNIWNEFVNIVNNSKHFKKYGGSFLHWIMNNYICSMVILISKLTDKKQKTDDISIIEYLKFKYKISHDKTILKDIQDIKDINKTFKEIRNKNIAHFTSTDVQQPPLFKDLNISINNLKIILKKYYFEETKNVYVHPNLLLKELFSKAWIKTE